jgi:uncharacterized membrane protein YkvA (DUF1232 family)
MGLETQNRMLFKELNKIIATIEFYDNKEGWRAFVEEVLKQDIPKLENLRSYPFDNRHNRQVQWTKMAIGAGWYSRLIKPLPVVIEIMGAVIEEKEGPAHARATLAGALAYLVQENEIIPNQTGGGYGTLDDALIIYYTYYKYLQDMAGRIPEIRSTMNNYCRELEAVIHTGLRVFPSSVLEELKRVLSNIASGFYHFPEAPTYLLEQVIEQVILNPRQNAIGQILARLAYRLDVNFKSSYSGYRQDAVLTKLEAMIAEAGCSPGELTSEGYYY